MKPEHKERLKKIIKNTDTKDFIDVNTAIFQIEREFIHRDEVRLAG